LQDQLIHPSFIKLAAVHSARLTATTTGAAGKTWLVVGLVLAAMAASTLVFWKPAQAPAATLAATVPPPPLTPVIPVDAPVHAVWDFNPGPVSNLKVLQGSWEWEKRGAVGGMKGTDTVNTVCLLPIQRPARPLVLTLKQPFPIGPNQKINLGAFWLKDGFTQQHLNHTYPNAQNVDLRKNLKLRIFFFENYVATSSDGILVSFCEYARDFDPSTIAVCLDPALFLGRMELQTIDPKDIPTLLRDVEQVKKTLSAKRVQEAMKVRSQP
jgi:hypothetical protein